MWIIPSEVTDALHRFSGTYGPQQASTDSGDTGTAPETPTPPPTPKRRRNKRPTTAAEIADQAPKAPKLDDTSLEDALAEPEIEEDLFQDRPTRGEDEEQN